MRTGFLLNRHRGAVKNAILFGIDGNAMERRSSNVRRQIDKEMAIIFLIERDLCGGIRVADGRPFNLLVLHFLTVHRPQGISYCFAR